MPERKQKSVQELAAEMTECIHDCELGRRETGEYIREMLRDELEAESERARAATIAEVCAYVGELGIAAVAEGIRLRFAGKGASGNDFCRECGQTVGEDFCDCGQWVSKEIGGDPACARCGAPTVVYDVEGAPPGAYPGNYICSRETCDAVTQVYAETNKGEDQS